MHTLIDQKTDREAHSKHFFNILERNENIFDFEHMGDSGVPGTMSRNSLLRVILTVTGTVVKQKMVIKIKLKMYNCKFSVELIC